MCRVRSVGLALPLALLACASLASCAPVSKLPELPKDEIAAEQRKQQIAQLRKYYGELRRVESVAFRLRTANAADCTNRVAPQIGMTLATPRSLPRAYQSYTAEALGIGWTRPTAISVAEGSPAAEAGIRAGDNVIAMNDAALPLRDITRWINKRLAETGTAPIKVNIRRDDVDSVATVIPKMGCSIPIQYKADETANASTSRSRIVIHTGIVAMTATDADLAMVIGHELAHSNLGHLHKKTFNMLLGMTAGSIIDAGLLSGGISTNHAFARQFGKFGSNAFSVGFEREADYVGSYYTARAGYELKGAEDVWRKMGLGSPAAILIARTHPTTATRAVQIQKVREEIEDKERRGLPLNPDMKYLTVDHDDSDASADATADDAS